MARYVFIDTSEGRKRLGVSGGRAILDTDGAPCCCGGGGCCHCPSMATTYRFVLRLRRMRVQTLGDNPIGGFYDVDIDVTAGPAVAGYYTFSPQGFNRYRVLRDEHTAAGSMTGYWAGVPQSIVFTEPATLFNPDTQQQEPIPELPASELGFQLTAQVMCVDPAEVFGAGLPVCAVDGIDDAAAVFGIEFGALLYRQQGTWVEGADRNLRNDAFDQLFNINHAAFIKRPDGTILPTLGTDQRNNGTQNLSGGFQLNSSPTEWWVEEVPGDLGPGLVVASVGGSVGDCKASGSVTYSARVAGEVPRSTSRLLGFTLGGGPGYANDHRSSLGWNIISDAPDGTLRFSADLEAFTVDIEGLGAPTLLPTRDPNPAVPIVAARAFGLQSLTCPEIGGDPTGEERSFRAFGLRYDVPQGDTEQKVCDYPFPLPSVCTDWRPRWNMGAFNQQFGSTAPWVNPSNAAGTIGDLTASPCDDPDMIASTTVGDGSQPLIPQGTDWLNLNAFRWQFDGWYNGESPAIQATDEIVRVRIEIDWRWATPIDDPDDCTFNDGRVSIVGWDVLGPIDVGLLPADIPISSGGCSGGQYPVQTLSLDAPIEAVFGVPSLTGSQARGGWATRIRLRASDLLRTRPGQIDAREFIGVVCARWEWLTNFDCQQSGVVPRADIAITTKLADTSQGRNCEGCGARGVVNALRGLIGV